MKITPWIILGLLWVLVACGTSNTDNRTTYDTDQPIAIDAIIPTIKPSLTPPATLSSTKTSILMSTPTLFPTPLIPTATPITISLDAPSWKDYQLIPVRTEFFTETNHRLIAWSPTNLQLLVSQNNQLMIINAENNQTTEITHTGRLINATWSPDGSSIAYITENIEAANPKNRTVWRWSSNIGTVKITEIDHTPFYQQIVWTNERQIAITTRKGVITYTFDTKNIKETVTFRIPSEYLQETSRHPDLGANASIFLAPDGIHGIVYDNYQLLGFFEGDQIINTVHVRWLTHGIQWSHDSQRVALHTNTKEMHIYSSDGTLEQRYLFYESDMIHPYAWSSHDQFLVYGFGTNSQREGIYIMVPGESGSFKIYDDNDWEGKDGRVGSVILSADDRYIAYTLTYFHAIPQHDEEIIYIQRIERK